jgi:hypothetical protein
MRMQEEQERERLAYKKGQRPEEKEHKNLHLTEKNFLTQGADNFSLMEAIMQVNSGTSEVLGKYMKQSLIQLEQSSDM